METHEHHLMTTTRSTQTPDSAPSNRTNLKKLHSFPEKCSIFPKFETFELQGKDPGEQIFAWTRWVLRTCVWATALLPTVALAQPATWIKVPAESGEFLWQISVQPDLLLVGTPHSSWLYAYSLKGELLWKRPVDWPLILPPRMWQGLLLLQQAGQPAWLLQPQTGELRQRLPREFSGWTVPWDSQRWVQLGAQGEVRLGSRDWKQWVTLGQLRLERGDAWLGPPAVSRSFLFITTKLGHLQRLGPFEDILPAAASKQDSPLPSETLRSKLDWSRSETADSGDMEEGTGEPGVSPVAANAPVPSPVGPPPDSPDAVNKGRVRGLRVRELPGVSRPLYGPISHPQGVVEVSLEGKLSLRRRRQPWIQPFPGWDDCYSARGRLIAHPVVDSRGDIYLATRNRILAWDGDTGQPLWTFPLASATAVQVHGDSLWAVEEGPPALLEIACADGTLRQRVDLPAPAASDLNIGGDVLALALRDGRILVRNLPPITPPDSE